MSKNDTNYTVAKVVDQFRVVINGGSEHGISEKDRFLVYRLGDEIIDPETKENLGRLELVKGTGRPIHIQARITTIQSDKVRQEPGTKKITKTAGHPFLGWGTPTVEELTASAQEIELPFDEPKVGDRVKRLAL